jgi:hypothetical protein
MSEVVPFPPRPGAPAPREPAGWGPVNRITAEIAAACDLLDAVRAHQPRAPCDIVAEHELQVFATAVKRLAVARPIAERAGAHEAANVDEVLVFVELIAERLRPLDPRRQLAALRTVIGTLTDALDPPHHG